MITRFHDGNRVTLLKNGAAFFPALVAAIDAAQIDVRLETYIFEDDPSGRLVRDALTRAAARGVAVRALVDGVGSRHTPQAFFDVAREAGAKVLLFRPDRRLFHVSTARMRRNHRKIALIDGHIGFLGGINLIDDLTESLSVYPRFDFAVKVEGPVLADVYSLVHATWRFVAWRQWRRHDVGARPLPVVSDAVGAHRARFVARDNFRHRRDIERLYRAAIGAAKQHVLIMCPYFLPGRAFRRTLLLAAKRGVVVTILLQGRADHPLLQMATRALYDRLFAAGVRIAEYDKSMLHGKVATIDDRWATVGSSNLDPFSLLLNREANIVVEDATFARELRLEVEAEIESGGRWCAARQWASRPWWERLKSRVAYAFARSVVSLLGLTRNWD
jgi:cardiolipin synthase